MNFAIGDQIYRASVSIDPFCYLVDRRVAHRIRSIDQDESGLTRLTCDDGLIVPALCAVATARTRQG